MSSPARFAAATLLVGLFAAPIARADAPATAEGFWVTEDHESVIHIAPCDDALCGRIVGLRHNHAPGEVPKDSKNPDAAQRETPICNLLFMGSFKPESDGKSWKDGWVYDPDSGKTYTAQMALNGPDKLDLRGYIGIPMLGRTQSWTRETGTPNRCPGAT